MSESIDDSSQPSTEPNVDLDIILMTPSKNAVFEAGSKLQGKVVLKVAREAIEASKLKVNIYGSEKTLVRYTKQSSGDITTCLADEISTRLTKSVASSYRKHSRAKEATTSGKLAELELAKNTEIDFGDSMDGLDMAAEKSFYHNMTMDFLKEIQAIVIKEAVAYGNSQKSDEEKATEKAVGDMQKFANEAVGFINKVRGISKQQKEAQVSSDADEYDEEEKKEDENANVVTLTPLESRQQYAEAALAFLNKVVPKDKNTTQLVNACQDFTSIITGNAHKIKKSSGNAEEECMRRLYEVKLPVDSSVVVKNGIIEPGAYEVPFECDLPEDLPSTLLCVETNGSKSRIEYRVKAVLKGSGYFWNYNVKRSFRVRAKVLDQVAQPYSTSSSATVRSVGIFNQGMIAAAAKLNDTLLDRGETCTVQLAFRNTAKVNVKNIKAKIMQECIFGSDSFLGGYKENVTVELSKNVFGTVDGTQKAPKASGKGKNAKKNILKELNADLESGTDVHGISFTMPVDAQPSYAGALIKTRHYVKIKVKTDSILTSNIELEIPIQCGESLEIEGEALVQAMNQVDLNSPNVVTQSAYTTGGKVTNVTDESDDDNDDDEEFDIEVPPQQEGDEEISMAKLLRDMEVSIHDWDIIQNYTQDPSWDSVFCEMTPDQYATLFGHVDFEFELADIGVAVAAKIGNRFTCSHLAEALKVLAQSNHSRTLLVEKVLPFCLSDLKANSEVIKQELTEWEDVATEGAFDDLMAKI